jgi:hypothetical protein
MYSFRSKMPRSAVTRVTEEAAAAAISREAPAGGPSGPVDRRQLEKSVSWTRGERARFVWYRLRLTVAEMNYATRRMAELRARL